MYTQRLLLYEGDLHSKCSLVRQGIKLDTYKDGCLVVLLAIMARLEGSSHTLY